MASRRYKLTFYIITALRIIVGVLFIFSGYLKLNDVVGFAYKLDKYWYAFEYAWDVPATALIDYSVTMAFAFSVLETVLGFFLLLGIMRGITTGLLFIMIIFFTFLTGWAAITRSVPDCGCFGDAFAVPPVVSFIKDVILIVMAGVLYIYRDDIRTLLPKTALRFGLGSVVVLGCTGFAVYTLRYEPLHDFRACKVGNSFKLATSFDPKKGESPLAGYNSIQEACELDRSEFTGPVLLIIMKDMEHVDASKLKHAAELAKSLDGSKVAVFGLTRTPEETRTKYASTFDMEFCITSQDEDLMKTCIRSNPGYLLLNDGVIKAKWSAAAAPTKADVDLALR